MNEKFCSPYPMMSGMNRRSLILGVLLVSLALNLFLAGLLIGRASRAPAKAEPPMAWAAQSLSTQQRQRVRRHFAEKQDEVRALRQTMRKATGRVRKAATAEPLDKNELQDALAELRGVQADYQAFMHNNMAEVAASLPREQRMAFLRQALQKEEQLQQRRKAPTKAPTKTPTSRSIEEEAPKEQ